MTPAPALHIAHWGSHGPRVVMIHGGVQGSSAAGERNFAAQQPLAEHGWQIIVPDRPGHGQSPDPGRGDDAECDAIWTGELLESGAHLVGHSFGGLVALCAAARRPGAVRSLILIEPGAHKIALRNPAVRTFVLRMAFAMVTSFSAARRAERVMKILGIPAASFGRDTGQLTGMGKALTRAKFPARSTILHDLATIRAAGIPLLVISAGWSEAFVATGDAVAAAGGGRHVIAPYENHFPQWQGGAFNTLIENFWLDHATR